MQIKFCQKIHLTDIWVLLIFQGVFLVGQCFGDPLPLQIEAQVFYDQSWNKILKSNSNDALNTTLSEAGKILAKSTDIKLSFNPQIIELQSDVIGKSGVDEMSKFRDLVKAFGIPADLNILLTAPRTYSWALGLSYQDSICSDLEKNLIIVRLHSPIFSAFTLVHEIGHAIGAHHIDNSASIMNQRLNFPISQNFDLHNLASINQLLVNQGRCLLISSTKQNQLRAQKSKDNFVISWKKFRTKQKFCVLTAYNLHNLSGASADKIKKYKILPNISRIKVKTTHNILSAKNLFWSLSCGSKTLTSDFTT